MNNMSQNIKSKIDELHNILRKELEANKENYNTLIYQQFQNIDRELKIFKNLIEQ
jgi:hypothetical protein